MKKFISIILVLSVLLSLLVVSASAGSASVFSLVVDLNGYEGNIDNGTLTLKNGSKSYSIESGKKNIFLFSGSEDFGMNRVTTVSFSDLNLEKYNSWEIIGAPENAVVDDGNSKVSILGDTGKWGYSIIEIKGNIIDFSLDSISYLVKTGAFASGWNGATLTIRPKINATGFTASVQSNDSSMGDVCAYIMNSANTTKLLATAYDGYSFDYWLKDGSTERIYENPYRVTLTEDSSYTAYFKEWKQPTVVASPVAGGSVSKNRVLDDTWNISAEATPGYTFSCWNGPDSWTSAEASIDVSVANNGDVYSAVFEPVSLTLGEELYIHSTFDYNSNITENWNYSGNAPSVGSRAVFRVPFTATGKTGNAAITVELFAGASAGGTPFRSEELTKSLSAEKKYHANVAIDAMPDVSQITAKLTLTTDAATTVASRTYSVSGLGSSQSNSDYTYVTSPSKTLTELALPGGPSDSGPSIQGVYADQSTAAANVYLYGQTGVYSLLGTAITELEGLAYVSDASYKGVAAIGPDGNGGLIAVVSGAGEGEQAVENWDGSVTYMKTPYVKVDKVTTPGYDASSWTGDIYACEFLWHWDGTQWSRIENSAFCDYDLDWSNPGSYKYDAPLINTNLAALVMSDDDIWVNKYHWTGSQWETHDYSFNSFARISDTCAYAGSSDGVYRYDGTSWTKLESISGDLEIRNYSQNYIVVKYPDYTPNYYLTAMSKTPKEL